MFLQMIRYFFSYSIDVPSSCSCFAAHSVHSAHSVQMVCDCDCDCDGGGGGGGGAGWTFELLLWLVPLLFER